MPKKINSNEQSKEILSKYKDILFRTCEMLENDDYKEKEIIKIVNDINKNFQHKDDKKPFSPIVIDSESFKTKQNKLKLFNDVNRVFKIVKTRLARIEKQEEIKISQSCSLKDISAYFNTTAQDMVVDFINLPYQTYSAKRGSDKELLLNGCLPLQFNPDLKGYRLLNLFRAIHYFNDYSSEDLKVPISSFYDSIKMGKILKPISPARNNDLIYFKVEKDHSEFDVIEITYGAQITSKVININTQKKPKLDHRVMDFREVFARHDLEYLSKVNIFNIEQMQLIHDIVQKDIDFKKTFSSIFRNKESQTIESSPSDSKISIIPLTKKI